MKKFVYRFWNALSLWMVMLIFPGLFSTAFAQQNPQAISPEGIKIPYTKFVLDNGLTLLVHEDHKAPIIAFEVWYHVGSKDEKPGKTGFAHLFEHLMFNGSENYNSDYFKPVQDAGASEVNGSTSQDRTNYLEVFPTSVLDLVLFLESDRMGHLRGAISQERLDEQRSVVQNENRQYMNAPYGITEWLICKAIYPQGHPYSWTVGGTNEDLDNAKLEDVKEWFRTYYGPNNSVIVLAGDITPEVALEKVKKYFGDIPPGPPISKQKEWIAPRTDSHRETVQDVVAQPRILKIWNVPQWGTREADYLDLTASILSSGKSSRLYKRLVMDEQLATGVSVSNNTMEIAGYYQVQVDVKPGEDLAKIEKILNEELTKFIQQGPTSDELLLAKNQSIANYIRSLEQIGGFSGKADVLAQSLVYSGDPDYYKTMLKRTYEATPADLQNTAKTWLSKGDYTLTVLPLGELSADEKGIDRTSLPKPGDPPLSKFPDFQRAKLKNGLNIILAESHSIPVVELSLYTNAGTAADPKEFPGLARLTADLMDEGTKNRNGMQLSDELLKLGTQLTTGTTLDNSYISLSSLKQNLEPSLSLFKEVALLPAFSEGDFKRVQKLQINRIKRDKSNPSNSTRRVMVKILYGENHPYGHPSIGYEETVNKIALQDIETFYKKWYLPNNSTLIVVGDITMAELLPKLEANFNAWKEGNAPKKQIPEVKPPQNQAIYIIDKPEAPQSEVLAGILMSSPKDPGIIAVDVMNKIFGGEPGARLFMNIREDKRWSYGAFSYRNDAVGQNTFLMWAPVQSDKTKETLEELQKEMKGIIGEKPITQDEFKKAVTSQANAMAGLWETMNAVEGSLDQLVKFGYPDDYFKKYPAVVSSLTWDDLNNAAKRIMKPDQIQWVIAGDRVKIEPKLKELGISNIHCVDGDGKVLP